MSTLLIICNALTVHLLLVDANRTPLGTSIKAPSHHDFTCGVQIIRENFPVRVRTYFDDLHFPSELYRSSSSSGFTTNLAELRSRSRTNHWPRCITEFPPLITYVLTRITNLAPIGRAEGAEHKPRTTTRICTSVVSHRETAPDLALTVLCSFRRSLSIAGDCNWIQRIGTSRRVVLLEAQGVARFYLLYFF